MHFYTPDGQIFTSKIRALEYANTNRLTLNLYYHDDVYNQCNWTVEPAAPLNDLYKEQAQRIRDNYDYVILCFSGGYDSSNILETFYYNNIKIDKIVTVGALSQDSRSMVDENHNGELYHNVFPYIKELGLESITQLCDYTTYFNNPENFSVSQYANEWVDYTGAWYSPHNWFWRDIEKYVIPREWGDKRVALIFGKDKPQIFFENDSPGFNFKDAPVTSYGNTSGSNNCDRINFYWDPTFPQILIKQLHILSKVARPGVDGINSDKLVYDLKRPILFKSPKSKTHILSLRDRYLMSKKDSDIYCMYFAGISRIGSTIGIKNLRIVYSQFYKIT